MLSKAGMYRAEQQHLPLAISRAASRLAYVRSRCVATLQLTATRSDNFRQSVNMVRCVQACTRSSSMRSGQQRPRMHACTLLSTVPLITHRTQDYTSFRKPFLGQKACARTQWSLTNRRAQIKSRHATAALPNIAFPDISPEVLTAPFQFANVAISVLWTPIIIAPRWKVTQAVMQSKWTIILPSIGFVYFFLAATVIDSPDLGDVFQKSKYLFTDASAEPRNMAKLLSSPAYAAQDWVHLLVWDFGAGRLIYLDALKKKVPMRPSLLVTFIAGPIGLLVHELTCAIVKPTASQEH